MKELGPSHAPELNSGMFCAVGGNPGVDACSVSWKLSGISSQISEIALHYCKSVIYFKIWCFKGDSGSGLLCIHNGILAIVGITSYGLDCGVVGMPGVYTTVAFTSNANFVESVIKKSDDQYINMNW